MPKCSYTQNKEGSDYFVETLSKFCPNAWNTIAHYVTQNLQISVFGIDRKIISHFKGQHTDRVKKIYKYVGII